RSGFGPVARLRPAPHLPGAPRRQPRNPVMHAAWYSKNGPANQVLTLGKMPTPEPAPGEVRVRLHSSGVNPSDVKSRRFRPLSDPRIIPHSDGAGIIDMVGDGVSAD